MLKEAIRSLIESELLSGALLLSILGGSIYYLKPFFGTIYNRIKRILIYTVRIEQTDELFAYLENWLRDHFEKEYRNVIAYIGEIFIPNTYEEEVEKNKDLRKEIKYRQGDDVIIIKRGGIFIYIRKGREKLENSSSLLSLFFDSFVISTFLFKGKIKKLLNDVMEYNARLAIESNLTKIYVFNGYNWRSLTGIRTKTIDQIILPDEQKSLLMNDINHFINSSKWYEEKSIPYKRGYLFYGTPGNGKSSLAVAIANYLHRPIYSMTISEVENDNDLRRAFNDLGSQAILLLEDIDTMFINRKSGSKGVSFTTLLNCLDGVFYKHGLIVIMTTNHIEKLDPALIREGRVDIKMELKNPSRDCVVSYLELFYGREINYPLNRYTNDHAMTKIQHICLKTDYETAVNQILNSKNELA